MAILVFHNNHPFIPMTLNTPIKLHPAPFLALIMQPYGESCGLGFPITPLPPFPWVQFQPFVGASPLYMGSALVRAFCVTNHQHPHPHVTLCHVCHACSHDVTTTDLFSLRFVFRHFACFVVCSTQFSNVSIVPSHSARSFHKSPSWCLYHCSIASLETTIVGVFTICDSSVCISQFNLEILHHFNLGCKKCK
jgi:hypothetical protein